MLVPAHDVAVPFLALLDIPPRCFDVVAGNALASLLGNRTRIVEAALNTALLAGEGVNMALQVDP